MNNTDDTLAAFAALDPLLAALLVALAAICLGGMALWAAVRLGTRRNEK